MNRSLQHLILVVLGLALGLLAACGGGGGGGGGDAPDTPPPQPDTTVMVKVLDVLGFAKPGASVEVVDAGTAPVSTGPDGTALIELAPDTDLLLLRISLPGHTQQFRPLRVASGQTAFLEARLMARAPPLTLPDAAAGGTLVGRNAARLTLPANALVDAASGAPVTGAVQVEMTPVNTASHELGAFPGTMRATSGGTEALLVTYGPVEYIFTQGGRPLRLAEGQSAVIEMPLHAALDIDGTPLVAGDTMPVWSLNETTGIWNQEGEGTIVASRSATGLALRATVNHFSWWNPDLTADRVTVNISFVFEGGVTPTVCCHLEAQTVPGFPGPSGIASTTLPPSGGSVVLNAPTLVIFSASGLSSAGALEGQAPDVSVPEGAGSINVTITLKVDPDAPNPVITSPEAGVTAYENGMLAVTASVSGGEPDLVELLANGQLIGPMSGSQDSGYTSAWDTTSFPEGSYQIVVRATRGDKVVPSVARTVIVDRTPPVLVTRSPAPGANQVTALAPITATFNEPIDPASLNNPPDAPTSSPPRIALLFGGPSSGTALPVLVEQSADARMLTITPVSALPTNTLYAVRLQGLTDRAGNAMVEQTWSFSVPLFALASPVLNLDAAGDETSVAGRPALALDGLGQPVLAWAKGVTSGAASRIEARRRIGAEWVSLPPLETTAQIADLSMDLDPSGQPIVAWTQATANTFGCGSNVFAPQLFVARFNGTAWVPLGSGALNIAPCSSPQLPRLRVDTLGRPVLVIGESLASFSYTMRVLRFENGEWTLLGNVPPRSVPAGSGLLELRLALDGNTPLVLTSENRSGQIDIFVSRLDGTAFVPVGPRVMVSSVNRRSALEIDPSGRPVVAIPVSVTSGLRVVRFDGTAWQDLGASVTTASADEPSLIFDAGGVPAVAWHDSFNVGLRVFGSRFDATLGQWGAPFVIKADVGRVSEWKRREPGGPVWLGLTTDGFRCCLRAITADTLP